MVWFVVWVVLMVLWLVLDLYYVPPGSPPVGPRVAGSVVPWACVLILGLFVFGAFGPARVVVAT